MTITKLLSEGCRPSPVAETFLKKITELEPLHAFTKSAVVPVGAYLVPFVDRNGKLVAWCPFVTRPSVGQPLYVQMEYRDPNTVWRLTESGFVKVASAVNEDY